jgi:hypothetical protein
MKPTSNVGINSRSMAASPVSKKKSIGLFGSLMTFAVVSAYLLYVRCGKHIILGAGATMILYATTGGDLIGSILAGALLALTVYFFYRPAHGKMSEGFQSEEDADAETEEPQIPEVPTVSDEPAEAAPVRKAAKAAKKVPAPDHGSRPGEMFELGKKYKMPVAEGEDADYHLDAGTTFMNAYKSLKPEQIAAMTKDTQELMQTQKQLMNTLQTLKPLITDGKQMMEMFQSYFGSANPTSN